MVINALAYNTAALIITVKKFCSIGLSCLAQAVLSNLGSLGYM